MHRNSHKNKSPHHLYEIYDKQEEEVFKYGISSDNIEEDGLSYRIRRQLRILNLAAGWVRYFARILLEGIAGRKRPKKSKMSLSRIMKTSTVECQEETCGKTEKRDKSREAMRLFK